MQRKRRTKQQEKGEAFSKTEEKKMPKGNLDYCKLLIYVKKTLVVNKIRNVVMKSAELRFTDRYLDR